jgi:hypothetical protein
MINYRYGLVLILAGLVLTSACTLGPPFDQLQALVEAEPTGAAGLVATVRPTFTPSPEITPTPSKTATPTLTPFPSETPTPLPPTETPTPPPTETPTITPTNSPAPPPPPTNTPGPTDTPAPSYGYFLAETFNSPTQANILSIMVAVQGADGGWVPGLRLVGIDPNGVVTKSEITAADITGYTPPAEVVKAGNTKFEPISNYVTGTWNFHLETPDGTQVSESYPLQMDVEAKQWYFMRFQPK